MKSILAAILVCFTLTSVAQASSFSYGADIAKKSNKKSEPAPGDERRGGGEESDPREETYEGNERGGGSFDGGGYSGGDDRGGGYWDGGGYGGGGGMAGEIFYVPGGKTYPVTRNIKTEDRGDVIVQTIVEHEDIDASETCTTITEMVIDKKTQKVISSNTREFCNRWPL